METTASSLVLGTICFIRRLFQGGPAEREGGGWQGSHIKGAKEGGKNLEKNFLVWDGVLFYFTQLKQITLLLMLMKARLSS